MGALLSVWMMCHSFMVQIEEDPRYGDQLIWLCCWTGGDLIRVYYSGSRDHKVGGAVWGSGLGRSRAAGYLSTPRDQRLPTSLVTLGVCICVCGGVCV